MAPKQSKYAVSKKPLADDVCIHIFSVSAAMLGVCVTVIGLLRVVIVLRRADTIADDIVAFDSLCFLASCLLSYWALRTRNVSRMHRVERIADFVFIFGLGLMALASLVITYAVAST